MGDARRPVHVHADVAFFGFQGFAGVQSHAHPHLNTFWPVVRGQGALDLHRGADRFRGAWEGHEEGIPLGVDLLSVPVGKGFSQDTALVSQQGRVLVAQSGSAVGSSLRCR